ncbi:MAG: hypothetical protein F6K31_20250 [Symploca sp. SIO2G7]|nr:hypothetical protein [Symploca sp. SIO2G7]
MASQMSCCLLPVACCLLPVACCLNLLPMLLVGYFHARCTRLFCQLNLKMAKTTSNS